MRTGEVRRESAFTCFESLEEMPLSVSSHFFHPGLSVLVYISVMLGAVYDAFVFICGVFSSSENLPSPLLPIA